MNRPLTTAAKVAPRMIPKSMTDVTSENTLAVSGLGLPRQYGQAATSDPAISAHFDPHSANPAVSPQGRPASTSVAAFNSASPTAPVISDHGPSQLPFRRVSAGDCPGANRQTAANTARCTASANGQPNSRCDVVDRNCGNPHHQCSVAAPTADRRPPTR